MLRDVIADPGRVLPLGTHQGEDFIDLLIRLIPANQGAVRKALITCLMCYQDPRTADFMAEIFSSSRDAETVLHLGERLALEKGVDFFLPFLWQQKAAQALAAARVCRRAGALESRDQLRVALLLEGENPVPAIGEVWAEELAGPHRGRARELAAGLGEQVLGLWSQPFPEAETEWLLELTIGLDPERARQEAARLLAAGRMTLTLLKMAQQLGLGLPESLLEHADPEIRALGIAAGMADSGLERYLTADRSVAEVLAALSRSSDPRAMVDLMSDRRWKVRSAAVNALTDCASRPLERVQALARSGSLEERVAAVELLCRWGETEWLEQTLRS